MISSDESFGVKLKSLIDKNLPDSSLSADVICREMGVSRSSLHRLVKEHTDLSVNLFIRQCRLERAKFLLKTTELRIAEIAELVGIPNPQNFSKYFTEAFAVSPTEFRRQKPESESITPDPAPEPALIQPITDPVYTPQPEDNLPVVVHKRQYRYLIAGVIVAGLAGLALYVWLQLGRQHHGVSSLLGTNQSIAILPFKNMGPTDTGPLVEGITDDLHTVLSLGDSLKVVARTSSDQYQNTKKSIWQIGDELQVANLLKGSVLKNGNQLQVKLELIRTNDDIRLWAKTFSGSYNDLFRLTDQMGQEVLQQLNPSGVQRTQTISRPVPTTNTVAYNAFLQGRQLMLTRSEDKLKAAISQFEQAVQLDEHFADAYAYKAVCYQLLIDMGYQTGQAIWNQGKQNALTAIQFDSTNSTAYATLGSLYANAYQWKQAEAAFRQALRHNANDAQANYWYSLLLRSVGRLKEAMTYSTKAHTLDPLYPVILTGHVLNCAYAGHFDLASQTLADGKLLFGDSFLYAFGQSLTALAKDDYAQAANAYREALRLNPNLTTQWPSLYYCEARLGQPAHARAYLATQPETPQILYNKAVVCAGLGDQVNCLRYLRQAADGGYVYRDLLVFPVFRPYHRNPAFRAILRQYGLPDSLPATAQISSGL
ncbi:helix-turn-helix domain-containing protein [Spirosoma foliorum]|uniref:Helix-turn-helix domain-containing protein n=1 Tax=Spirosoma foliorum TaxID=2710596 RepID=A0A7G5GWN8_9BACT|nr:helix-turn-helix domain-containing protein [Spirosoma foliorum]QMW03280.1 helix-turn-helix domain-containing protein [Spirosoma foliorum]